MPPSQTGESSNLNLPPPVMEAGVTEPSANETGAKNVAEKLATSPEAANGVKTPAVGSSPIQQISIPDLPTFTPPPTSAAVANDTTSVMTPEVADDGDLIEKEWVVKAKKIVDSNRDNPYNQSKEMTTFRADYMKKRYNKTINISD